VGYAVGYYLANADRRSQAVYILIYLAPWFVSIIVKAFGWTLLLAPNGYINKMLLGLGLLDKPLRLMWSELGVIIGMVHIYLIFVVLSVFSCLVGQDPLLRRAAANLGATGWQTFKRVTLPLSLPGLLVGSVIVFTLTMSAFVTPAVLGGRRVQMIANMAFNQTVEMLNWPFGGAIALFLMMLTVAIVLGYQRLIVMGKWKVIFR
jgi:putative spermidine/putrescine transport system permease protein